MFFGRAFEKAISAYFLREDCPATFVAEWSKVRSAEMRFTARDSWESMWQAGLQLLRLFAQDDRVRINRPRQNLQRKVMRGRQVSATQRHSFSAERLP
jgi:hypothetical protein